MFTGLILDQGRVRGIHRDGDSLRLSLETRLVAELALGDSLSVNGVCLTVTTRDAAGVQVTVIPETVSRTTLRTLSVGTVVNLEPAIRPLDRLGGHIVQGHVDGVGTIDRIVQLGIAREMRVSLEPSLSPFVVEKGSIAVDGVSLTVAAMEVAFFTVALIPLTLSSTTLGTREIGQQVNLEVDILAKYVARMLQLGAHPGRGAEIGPVGVKGEVEAETGHITEAWLRERGF